MTALRTLSEVEETVLGKLLAGPSSGITLRQMQQRLRKLQRGAVRRALDALVADGVIDSHYWARNGRDLWRFVIKDRDRAEYLLDPARQGWSAVPRLRASALAD